ncbi:hypothetical protein V6Z11_D07G168600 [Gossypium hirsutum]
MEEDKMPQMFHGWTQLQKLLEFIYSAPAPPAPSDPIP